MRLLNLPVCLRRLPYVPALLALPLLALALAPAAGQPPKERLFLEKLAEGGLARREHAPEVGAAEPALPAAAGLPDKLAQRPSRRPGPWEELGERDALADAHGHEYG